jgi:hypothetical protein
MIRQMAFRVAGVSVPDPSDVLEAASTAAGWSTRAVGLAASMPEWLGTLLDDADQLVQRITTDNAATVILAAGALTTEATTAVTATTTLTARASAIVDDAAAATSGATRILDTYAPLAQRAAPLAKRFVDELSEEEVQAAIELIDQLPMLTRSMQQDIMPILATLDRVGPDVHELLEVLKEVRHAITGIPGFRFFRKRGEAEEREEAQAAADRRS